MNGTENRIFYEVIKNRIVYLEELIETKKRTLTKAPKGSLLVSKHRNEYQYYLRIDPKDKKGNYLKKKEIGIVRKLAQKKYDERIIIEAQKELSSLQRFNEELGDNPYANIYKGFKFEEGLIDTLDSTDEEFLNKWKDVEFSKLGFSENAPEYYSKKGERMRSKSETIIANKLDEYGIPYIYEYPIKVEGNMFCPDFRILNVRTRKTIYWEHFGRMDDREYISDAIKKINVYSKNGMIMGRDFIASFESLSVPIDYRVIEKMIKDYLI